MAKGWIEHGSGIYERQPETDPEVIEQQERKYQTWKAFFEQVMKMKDEHGWDSPECQLARIDLKEWQKSEREKAAQVVQ